MLEALKVIILGIVQGITEWLPISSTGHLILVEELIKLKQNDAFKNMFNVVIQFGSIMAVVVIYFHKLNPFSPTKTQKQKMMTIQLWIKVIIGTLPAMIVGLLLNDWIEAKMSNAYVVAFMLILYGILFIVIENINAKREPRVTKLSQLSVPTVLLIGVFQMMAMIPGTSRSGATIVGALALGVSRGVAAEFTWNFQNCCSGIYIFPCNSGYVRCKCIEVIQVWTRIYTNAGVFIAAWNACIVWSIDYCNQVPDEVYQKQ